MTGIFASIPVAGKQRCARCGRPITPKKAGDLYGPKCARILAGQISLDSQTLVSGKVQRKRKEQSVPIYVKGEKGEVTAVIL